MAETYDPLDTLAFGANLLPVAKRNDVDSASPDFCRNLLMEMKAGKIGRHFAWYYASD